MSDFNPGPGWQISDRYHPRDEQIVHYEPNVSPQKATYWVREEPVPPLPTEENTLIRADLNGNKEDFVRRPEYWDRVDSSGWVEPVELQKRITGFEVLASPKFTTGDWEEAAQNAKRVRRETAKAVLDRVRTKRHDFWTLTNADADEIAKEFGVDDAGS